MTLQDLTYDLKELIRGAHIIDDERIDDRLVHEWVHQQRALLAKQSGDKGVFYDDPLLQDYTIELEYDQVYIPNRAAVLKSKNKIPPVVPLKYGNSILELRGEDFSLEGSSATPNTNTLSINEISVVSWNQLRVMGESKFTSNIIFSAIRDGYYYIKYGKNYLDKGHLKNLIIRGVFENPEKVPGYDIETSEYPMSLAMINILKRNILQTDLAVVLSTLPDENNDSSGDVV